MENNLPDHKTAFDARRHEIEATMPSLRFEAIAQHISGDGSDPKIPLTVFSNMIRACEDPALEAAFTQRLLALPEWEEAVAKLLCSALPTKAVIRIVVDVLGQKKPTHVLSRVKAFSMIANIFDAMVDDSLIQFEVPFHAQVRVGAAVVALNYEDPLQSWLTGTVAEKNTHSVFVRLNDIQRFDTKRLIPAPLILLVDVELAKEKTLSKIRNKVLGA